MRSDLETVVVVIEPRQSGLDILRLSCTRAVKTKDSRLWMTSFVSSFLDGRTIIVALLITT